MHGSAEVRSTNAVARSVRRPHTAIRARPAGRPRRAATLHLRCAGLPARRPTPRRSHHPPGRRLRASRRPHRRGRTAPPPPRVGPTPRATGRARARTPRSLRPSAAICGTVAGSASGSDVTASVASSARYAARSRTRPRLTASSTPPARLPADQTATSSPAWPGAPTPVANAGTSTHVAPMQTQYAMCTAPSVRTPAAHSGDVRLGRPARAPPLGARRRRRPPPTPPHRRLRWRATPPRDRRRPSSPSPRAVRPRRRPPGRPRSRRMRACEPVLARVVGAGPACCCPPAA